MNMSRQELLRALLIIKPALATKDIVEELSHIWFDGEHAMAYNDAELGIQIPLETPFKGGIRGALLLGLLSNSRAKEISLEPSGDGSMVLKAARTRANISVHDISRSPWQFPALSKKAFPIDSDFLEALKSVLISVGKETTTPETLGVTIYFGTEDGETAFFATDTDTIAYANCHTFKPFAKKALDHVILPLAFCEQLLRLCSAGSLLEIQDDCAIAGGDNGVLIYARRQQPSKKYPLYDLLNKYEEIPKKSLFPVPERLALALDRMAVLFDGMPPGETMLVEIGDSLMKLSAEVKGRGELKDSVKIPEYVPSIKFRTDPSWLKRAVGIPDSDMVCFGDAVRISAPGFVYLCSNLEA